MCSSIAKESGEPWDQVENAFLTAYLYLKSLGRLLSGILYVMFASLPMAAVWKQIIFKVLSNVSHSMILCIKILQDTLFTLQVFLKNLFLLFESIARTLKRMMAETDSVS